MVHVLRIRSPDRRTRVRGLPDETPSYTLLAPGACKIHRGCSVLSVVAAVPIQIIVYSQAALLTRWASFQSYFRGVSSCQSRRDRKLLVAILYLSFLLKDDPLKSFDIRLPLSFSSEIPDLHCVIRPREKKKRVRG